ncbi:6-hydroxymethylpterin diphosphokinase MptE-like protein [Siminovitchia sp. FSL H7-0308]|uniref:Motility associated factor glycosyltransferase family protein n=1 Tax=Siminovitchia thermophila TaxID=1245522 RepID=A0ABS2R479_9BACI|nr:6-hydroxymethylpterin diphosphokinase MptE-like protein [Siminovitchia thermophila]MBM7714195.1 hypothetical protein [Siminovitchia thermophila]ONK23389.1 hypothetical protein BLX87_11010 [Bacillus sp. VT-16-64]
MILINNRNYLRLRNRHLLQQLNEMESRLDEKRVVIEPSKKENPTLKINKGGKFQYIHSKYDPVNESKRIMQQQKNMEAYDHVFFVGTGLGYHIEQFAKVYPDKKITIFEPDLEVLYHFLTVQDITKFSSQIQAIFFASEESEMKQEVQKFINIHGKRIFFFTLPVYLTLYPQETKLLFETFKEGLKDQKNILATAAAFQKRWTINAIKNFPYVLKTPNILHDIDQKAFEGKPAIIVAAGPSLSEEFEHLKFIKENGLAYIFSVGSAINALIEHGIYPDAACTYDPKERNQNVIRIIKDRGIEEIPLIYGSSVGFETLENYPGPMLHMITSQDPVSPFLLGSYKKISIVQDAPSIAVVTFQLLALLGFKQIILVGQNLAFHNRLRFAKGIHYNHIPKEISPEEEQHLITVKDVYGNDIYTDSSFNQMRQQLELYISMSPNVEVLNTTKGGAVIEGTTFLPLTEVIEHHLRKKKSVSPQWYKANNHYNQMYAYKQLVKLEIALGKMEPIMERALTVVKNIADSVEKLHVANMETNFIKLDKEIKKLKENPFYKYFIEPMVRVQHKLLEESNKEIRFEKNLYKKGNQVVESYRAFLEECVAHVQYVKPYFYELKNNTIFESEQNDY